MNHYSLNLWRLPLGPPTGPGGLPDPDQVGPPRELTGGQEWHVHNGGISRDGSMVVYTRDYDEADLFVLEGVER